MEKPLQQNQATFLTTTPGGKIGCLVLFNQLTEGFTCRVLFGWLVTGVMP
jgi:hypothetical protein